MFLGYPPEDVCGFINNSGSGYKCVGCWKAYGDANKAKKTFDKYERCRKVCTSLIENGKKIALFGSYGWGDGEWMRTWEDDCKSCGAVLATESVICNGEPDGDITAKCEQLGASLIN